MAFGTSMSPQVPLGARLTMLTEHLFRSACITPTRRGGYSPWPNCRRNRTSLPSCSPPIPRRRSASPRRTVAATRAYSPRPGKTNPMRPCALRWPRHWSPCSPKPGQCSGNGIPGARSSAPMRCVPMWHAAPPMRSVAAARSLRSARKALLVELALTAEHAETRMAAAERVRTPEGCASSRTPPRTRIVASRDSPGNGSTRWRIAKRCCRSGCNRGATGGAGEQTRSDTHGRDRAQSPLASAEP